MKIIRENKAPWVGNWKCPNCLSEFVLENSDSVLADYPSRDRPVRSFRIYCPACKREVRPIRLDDSKD